MYWSSGLDGWEMLGGLSGEGVFGNGELFGAWEGEGLGRGSRDKKPLMRSILGVGA